MDILDDLPSMLDPIIEETLSDHQGGFHGRKECQVIGVQASNYGKALYLIDLTDKSCSPETLDIEPVPEPTGSI